MRNLIFKDLILNKRYLLWVGVFYVAYLGFFGSRLSSPRLALLVGAFMSALMPLLNYTREDKFKAALLSCSLPSTRKQIVRSRYVLSWLLMLAVYLLIVPAMAFFPGGKLGLASLVNVHSIFLFLTVLTLVFAVLMPLLLRFGLVGMFVFLIGMQVLGIAVMVLESQKLVHLDIRGAVARVAGGLRSLNAALGGPAYFALLFVGLVLLNLASLAGSTFLFKRKDL
jgi:hypothetical protein